MAGSLSTRTTRRWRPPVPERMEPDPEFIAHVRVKMELVVQVPVKDDSFSTVARIAPGMAVCFLENAVEKLAASKDWKPEYSILEHRGEPKVLEIRGLWKVPDDVFEAVAKQVAD